MQLFKTAAGPAMPAPELITKEEVEQVLVVTKSGKSCGRDGAPYEFWAAVLQSEASEHLLDFLNEVLLGNQDFPLGLATVSDRPASESKRTHTTQGL